MCNVSYDDRGASKFEVIASVCDALTSDHAMPPSQNKQHRDHMPFGVLKMPVSPLAVLSMHVPSQPIGSLIGNQVTYLEGGMKMPPWPAIVVTGR